MDFPKKMNYSRYLTAVSLARQPSALRKLTAIQNAGPPTLITLATGAPNSTLFPFHEATITLKDGSSFKLSDSLMTAALQYGPTPGFTPLVKWLKGLQQRLHNPPTLTRPGPEGGLDLVVTTGSMDGLAKAFDMLIKPGDNILIDTPTYAGTLSALHPLGCKFLDVQTDHCGMVPDALRNKLSKWTPGDSKKADSDIPKVLYTIPNGCNPTGASLTESRKREIYKIAQEYDLLIMEDDPYYFLQYTDSPAPSFLSMDVDGRVLRFDSFSKILSSGMRVGFVTGPAPLIERVQLHMQVSVLHTSSMAQVMLFKLFDMWGDDGFKEQVKRVKTFYSQQKDIMIAAAEKWLTGWAEWHAPVAGMFLWIRLIGIEDTKSLIEEKAMSKEVLLAPGYVFLSDPNEKTSYIRASFSQATPEQIDKGFERLASLIKEELAAQGK